jgi:rhamnose transport system substrate-binding protein
MKRTAIVVVAGLLFAAGSVFAKGANEAPKKQGLTIIWMPKFLGLDYFNTCRKGAEEAGKELGITIKEDAPLTGDATKQVEMIDNFITQKVDILAISANDPKALAPITKKAIAAGIPTLTWDADVDSATSGRRIFINQTSYELYGRGLAKSAAKHAGENARVGILTTFFTAPNQSKWVEWMKKEMAENHPKMKLVDIREGEEDQNVAFRVTQDMIKANPDMNCIIAISSAISPGAAEAIAQMGAKDRVNLIASSTPNAVKKYMKSGDMKAALLWNTQDLGYLTVYAAKAFYDHTITGKQGEKFKVGRMGEYTIGKDGEIVLGPPFEFNAGNIDQFNF